MPSVNHFGLTVADLEESTSFYRDVVGMREVEGACNLSIAGEWFDQLTDNSGADLRVSHLEAEGVQLQLVEYAAAGGAALPLAHKQVGNPHICLNVLDLEGHFERVRADGRYKTSPLVRIGETPFRSFYVTDPNGVLVEFMEESQSST